MNLLTKLFRFMKAARLWLSALKHASAGDDAAALASLLSLEKLGLKKITEAEVLKLTILGRLNRLSEAVKLTPGVLELIKKDKSLSTPEKRYLALALWNSVGTLEEEVQQIFWDAGYDQSLVEAGTAGVSERLQKMFPM